MMLNDFVLCPALPLAVHRFSTASTLPRHPSGAKCDAARRAVGNLVRRQGERSGFAKVRFFALLFLQRSGFVGSKFRHRFIHYAT